MLKKMLKHITKSPFVSAYRPARLTATISKEEDILPQNLSFPAVCVRLNDMYIPVRLLLVG